MVLTTRSPSKYNEMRGRLSQTTLSTAAQSQQPFKVTDTTPEVERPPKRLKHSVNDSLENGDVSINAATGLRQSSRDETGAATHADVNSLETEDTSLEGEVPSSQPTDLEWALPPVKTDREAIAEYEAMRAAEATEGANSLDADLHERLGNRQWVKGKSSIYVDAFNLALETVLLDESHLFDVAEREVFECWRRLGYEAQYLYVRLFLRKTSAWHRINRLGYYDDVGDLNAAVNELFESRSLPQHSEQAKDNPGEGCTPEGTVLGNVFTFAESSATHITSVDEAASLLLLDELKDISKEAKVQGKTKGELLKALRRSSGKQTSLPFSSLRRNSTEESVASEASEASTSRDPSPTKKDQSAVGRDSYFLSKILGQTGPCIRLTSAPLKLFERVHLVFYRSSEWTEKSLTTIILARISQRNFPQYIVSRSANIFASRDLLLEFEASIRTQFRVDNILEFNGPPSQQDLQTIIDIFEEILPRWRTLLVDEQLKEDSIYESGEGAYMRRLSPAWVYTRIVHKGAYVLGLGKFKEHKREYDTLSELLDQRLFHPARRGAWYQRKALLEEHYMHAYHPANGRSPEEQKRHWKRIALRTCEEGLEDPLVHLIYHYDLQKRIMKLERSLRVSKREQHEFAHVTLAKPAERTFEGIQIEKRWEPRPLTARRSSNAVPAATSVLAQGGMPATANGGGRRGAKTLWLDPHPHHESISTSPPTPDTRSASSEPQYLSVEEMCLSHYRSLGWQGYHTEGGLMRTLFALLFYDVLFDTYVPNVFQTAYQTAPLDLHAGEGAFIAARHSAVNARLAEIDNGAAEGILTRTWTAHAAQRTCVVGLDWSFPLQELQEIVRAFGGAKLSRVLLVLAQEYAQRGGGMPDLLLWRNKAVGDESKGEASGTVRELLVDQNPEQMQDTGEVMFAEVKSAHDRLSDTQRLWLHVLAGAGIRVELCNAVAKEVREVRVR